MAYQRFPGSGAWIPDGYMGLNYTTLAFLSSTAQIDATGEKIAFVGRVWTPSGGSKSISRVGFRFGTITKAGGSGLTVSLQDVTLSTGVPYQPDGTPDQTVAISNGDSSFASNTWYRTGALSANRSVNPGDWLAVVIEYDGSGRLSSDVVRTTGQRSNGATAQALGNGDQLIYTGSWATNPESASNIILEFSDGSFGTLEGGFPLSALSTVAYHADSTNDEHALHIKFPFPCKIDAAFAIVQIASNAANFDFVLYEGTSAVTNGTVSCDANAFAATAATRMTKIVFPAELELDANTDYYLAIKPTQNTALVTLPYFDVSDANHFQAHPGGTEFYIAARADGGSWTPTTTRRPYMGVRVSSVDDAVSTGGMILSRVQSGM